MKQSYHINWRYTSNLGGPWQAGDEVSLDEATAIAINNDSPGVLTLVRPEEEARAADEAAPPDGVAPPDAPPADRQVKRAHKRTVEQYMPAAPEQPRTQEPIDTTVYKAVRDKG